MDNMPAPEFHDSHPAPGHAGARPSWLPPCPPDLNPIEQLFAKLEALLRTVDALRHAIGQPVPALALRMRQRPRPMPAMIRLIEVRSSPLPGGCLTLAGGAIAKRIRDRLGTTAA